jgi:hypothetical protein
MDEGLVQKDAGRATKKQLDDANNLTPTETK